MTIQDVEARRRAELVKRMRAAEIARFGEVRLPWIAFPDVHPFDIYWRMGPGEGHLIVLALHASLQSLPERIAQLRQSRVPADWAWWACERIDPILLATCSDTFGPYDLSFEEVRDALTRHGIEVVGSPS